MVSWTDFASLLCLALIILAVAAVVTASQNFVIVRGRVVGNGSAFIVSGGEKVPTKTVTVIIENTDRVFRIQPGTAVEYAVSEKDAELAEIGSEVELFITRHQSQVKVVSVEGRPRL